MSNLFFKKIGLIENRLHENKKFIMIFYFVGICGMLIPFTSGFFRIITPFALILNFVILTAYHQNKLNFKTVFVFSLIYLFGYLVEVAGVNTSLIFGEYFYGKSLGPKVFETPLIIGLNWLFLCYVSNSMLENVKINNVFKIIFASTLMLIYDIVLEQVAPILDFWYWKNNIVPLQNYIAWFVIALIFNSLIKLLKINTSNPISKIIFISQFLFFTILYIFYIII